MSSPEEVVSYVPSVVFRLIRSRYRAGGWLTENSCKSVGVCRFAVSIDIIVVFSVVEAVWSFHITRAYCVRDFSLVMLAKVFVLIIRCYVEELRFSSPPFLCVLGSFCWTVKYRSYGTETVANTRPKEIIFTI